MHIIHHSSRTLPPIRLRASMIVTWNECSSKTVAQRRPETPAPIMHTWGAMAQALLRDRDIGFVVEEVRESGVWLRPRVFGAATLGSHSRVKCGHPIFFTEDEAKRDFSFLSGKSVVLSAKTPPKSTQSTWYDKRSWPGNEPHTDDIWSIYNKINNEFKYILNRSNWSLYTTISIVIFLKIIYLRFGGDIGPRADQLHGRLPHSCDVHFQINDPLIHLFAGCGLHPNT